MTEELQKSTSQCKEDEQSTEENLNTTENVDCTPTNVSQHRTFAPMNIPLSRRRQTLTILVWFLMPWTCFYFTFVLLRSHNWIILGLTVLYLTWMMLFQRFPREGGLKQQWLRRLKWWTWFSG